jgi:hypothetical protein
LLLFLALLAVVAPAFYCNSPVEPAKGQGAGAQSPWLNVYDTSVHYVGIENCRGCHSDIYETFMKTGMGQSFAPATRQKSAADFGAHASVYDKDLDFWYHPFFEGDSMYILEYRLEGSDTVHKRKQRIDYVIGSGHHTNSHIFSSGGYFYQAPITFYTQKRKWDLAPGFDKGTSTRFARLIETECMTCHNGLPEAVATSQNKYISVKSGIDCERCHGPGSLHAAEKSAGHILDTSKGPDYSIVNPRRLSADLQNNICQRCHLQGITVLNDNKTFFDFRPGMKLSEVMTTFMPQYEGAADKMIMASHVERMKKSPCFINSGQMSCITCHNPHVSVKYTPIAQYTSACKSCHGEAGKTDCSLPMAQRAAKGDNCITCHMAKNSSIDIPHVAVTDHYIRRRPSVSDEAKEITKFLGLRSFNNDAPDAITIARGYMEFFERYNPSPGLIDSALYYLGKQQKEEQARAVNKDYIRAYFLLKNYPKVIGYAASQQASNCSDPWMAYRVGESYFLQNQQALALPWYARAVEISRHSLDFQSKYGVCLMSVGKLAEAMKVFEFIASENPDYLSANTNLGFLYMQQGDATAAFDYLTRAQALDPDYEQNLINLAVWYHNNGSAGNAKRVLGHLLKKHPDNARAKAMMLDL